MKSSNSSEADVSSIPWWLVATLCVVFFLWLLTTSPGHNWGGDFSQYIQHAINLSEGRSYAETGCIQNPFVFAGPAVYSPIFPITLVPVYLLFGLEWIALKAVVIAAFCLAMYFLVSLQGNKLNNVYQFAIIIFLALNPYFWWLKDQVLSDYNFLLICLLMLTILNKRYIKGADGYLDIKENSWGFAVLMGLFFYISFATREIGVVFIPTVLCFELFHFRKISLATSVAIIIFVLSVGFQHAMLKAPDKGVEANQ